MWVVAHGAYSNNNTAGPKSGRLQLHWQGLPLCVQLLNAGLGGQSEWCCHRLKVVKLVTGKKSHMCLGQVSYI